MVHTLEISAADHAIKSVTVFKSSKAEVVRTLSVDLVTGQNKIDITELPSSIDTQSVRVSGLGQARLFDVVCKLGNKRRFQEDPDGFSEVIRQLELAKQALVAEKCILDNEANFLIEYSKTLTAEHINPSQFTEFLASFVAQGSKNREAASEIEEKIVAVTRKIEREAAKQQEKKGETNGQVTIVVVTQDPGVLELKLTYIVDNVTWEPTYELHATTENGKPSSSVGLHYRARVKQSTGEDWNNAALTLSTVASHGGKNIPHLHPLTIRQQHRSNTFGPGKAQLQLQQQQQQLFGQTAFGGVPNMPASQIVGQAQPNVTGFGQPNARSLPSGFSPFGATAVAPTAASLFGSGSATTATAASGSGFGEGSADESVPVPDEGFEEVVVPGAMAEPTTVVVETPLALSYSVEGNSSIPSDGVEHQVSVAVLTFECKVTHVTIPRIDAQVYLQCQVKNTSDYRLLPGPVVVILDDSYVSKTSIQDVNKGDTFDCTLGADSATQITYSRTSKTTRSTTGHFAEAFNSTTYTSLINIQNKHHFAISDLVVRDAVPVCGDKRVKVILRKPAGLADAKDGEVVTLRDGLKVRWGAVVDGKGGEKEGKMDWLWSIEAGQKITLEAVWEVKAPADTTWVETVL